MVYGSSQKISKAGGTFREKDPAASALAHLPTEVEKRTLASTMPIFSVVDEKKRDFILKKPAAATHPTSRAKLTEEFLYFDD